MPDIKTITKQRIFSDVLDSVEPEGGWKVLVVDEGATRVLSACAKMFDVVEAGVTVVEPLGQSRQPLPKMEAIYLVEPIDASVDRIINDFSDAKNPLYSAVHIFFLTSVSDELVTRIKSCAPLAKRIRTFRDLNLNYVAFEQRCFHLNHPLGLLNLFSPYTNRLQSEISFLAERLLTLCVSMNEYPIIRFGQGQIASALGKAVNDRLRFFSKSNKSWKPNVGENRSTLLVLDRSEDPVSPLLHEFTYQAMLYDVVKGIRPHVEFKLGQDPNSTSGPVVADSYNFTFRTTKGTETTKTVLLGEHDPLWGHLRHMHIADAINWVISEMNQFVKDNKAANFKKSEIKTVDDMREALHALPEYKEMLAKYELHVHLAQECMTVFDQEKLNDIGLVEQGMVTGEDGEGKTFKNPLTAISPLLADDSISVENKMRLIMIYIISQDGVDDKTRKKLMENAGLSMQEQFTIENLQYMGISLKKSKSLTSGKKYDKTKKGKKSQMSDQFSYELSRYQPQIKFILSDLLDNDLDKSMYPFADQEGVGGSSSNTGTTRKKQGTSLRTTNARWAGGEKGKSGGDDGSSSGKRTIVFVAGGMSFSEMRCVYELSSKKKADIFLGSSHICTPAMFLETLRQMKPPSNSSSITMDDDDEPTEKTKEATQEKAEKKEENPRSSSSSSSSTSSSVTTGTTKKSKK